ncbi:MAG: DNA polymerase III subunit chi [Gammaproteobacteria bacterium]|nr:DNA polymerase III subunit chi [Gammaproteobacteria bacterium]
MTRIDFYQIENDESAASFACRLIEKVYRLGHRVYIHTRNADEAAAIDDLLWTFREDRFIPHACKDTSEDAPIVIGHDAEPGDHQDVLVNLSGTVPDFFSRFERVAEVVPLDQNSRDAARTNYKFYKDRGYPLHYHAMNA